MEQKQIPLLGQEDNSQPAEKVSAKQTTEQRTERHKAKLAADPRFAAWALLGTTQTTPSSTQEQQP